MAKSDVATLENSVYVFGRRYVKDAKGNLIPASGREKNRGSFGCETVVMRVPVVVVPLIKQILSQFSEIEALRRNIARNVCNTSGSVESSFLVPPIDELLGKGA